MATGSFVHQAVVYDNAQTLTTAGALRESLVDASRFEVVDPGAVFTSNR